MYQVMGGQYTPSWYKPRGTAAATPAAGASPLAGTGSVVTGAPSREYNPAFGGIPQVTNPSQVVANTIAGNVANLPAAQTLAGGVNTFNIGQSVQPLIANLPNYEAMTGAASENILGNLQGQLSPDVMQAIQQSAAERGIVTGGAGGPNANAAYLRALGLTSLDLQNLGQGQLTAAIARMPQVNLMNPASEMLSADQALSSQAAADVYNAAPSPQAANEAGVSAINAGMGRGYGAVGVPSMGALYTQPRPAATYGAGVSPYYTPTNPTTLGTGTLTEVAPPMTPDTTYQYDPWALGSGSTPTETSNVADYSYENDPWGVGAGDYNTQNLDDYLQSLYY